MPKFRPTSQILETVQASFLRSNVDGVGSSPDALPILEKKRGSSEEIVNTSEKSWEEPPLPKPLSERKTSDVRLPGAELRDEEGEEQALEKERRAKEIVNYLQEKWHLEIDKKSSLQSINYRTVEMLLHRRPPNHWLLKRARQKISEHTGFFSDVTKPYEFLGVPEMDGDMLLFHNLPDTIKISPDEWLTVQLDRQQEKEKRNARLPRIPYVRSKRSGYTRGRIKRGAGGITQIEKLMKNGEGFQRDIRGTLTYTKLLEKWFETKEEEMANRGSPFGQVKRSKVDKKPEVMPDLTGKSGSGGGEVERDENGRIIGTGMDDKAYQKFVNLEKMMTAIYYLVKSMLNVKMKQITSQNRIPYSGVMELRSRSPTGSRRQKNSPQDVLNKFNENSRIYAALAHGITKKKLKIHPSAESEFGEYESDAEVNVEYMDRENRDAPFENHKFKGSVLSHHSSMKFKGSGRTVPNPFNPVTVAEIYPLSHTNSAEDMKVAVGRIKQIIESQSYLDDRPYELHSVTLRKERPLSQGERIRRHYERFRAMFHRHEKRPESIWWNVHVRDYKKVKTVLENEGDEIPLKSPDSNKSPLLSISRSGKIPDPDQILTPKFPGPPSIENLNSEEQSRLNLLGTIPAEASAGPPSSPIRKLYTAAGIQTMVYDLFEIMMSIKRRFRVLEKSLRVNITSEVEKYEWDVLKRYKAKIPADCADPIYENAIGNMRRLAKMAVQRELDELENMFDETDPAEKQPAPWFRDLIEMCDQIGALRHHGCSTIVHKLLRYCDLNSHSKPYMLRRFCLLVVSLPANELASPIFHNAIIFLLDHLFGSPVELLQEWLQYRGLKPLNV